MFVFFLLDGKVHDTVRSLTPEVLSVLRMSIGFGQTRSDLNVIAEGLYL